MSGQNKNTAPNFTMRPPYPFPLMNIDKIPNLQNGNQKNNNSGQQGVNPPQMPMGSNHAPPFYPPRFINPFMNSYGMMHMPPFIPYSPFGRQTGINPPAQNAPIQQANVQGKEQQIAFFNPSKKMPEVIEVENFQKSAQTKKNSTHHIINPQTKQKKSQDTKKAEETVPAAKQPPLQIKKKQTEKPQPKYIPYESKKKYKKEIVTLEPLLCQRKTREKKPTIERLFIQIMKEKPNRDMVTKIGKDHQAIIPQSYLNEYEYTLKVKMEKKKSLMERMTVKNSESKQLKTIAVQNPCKE